MDEKLKKILENVKEEADGPSSNPVHFYDGKWWFWDEIWVNRMGPFENEKEAHKGIVRYCKEVLGH